MLNLIIMTKTIADLMLDNRESARVKFHFLWDSLSFRTKLLDDLLFSFVLLGF